METIQRFDAAQPNGIPKPEISCKSNYRVLMAEDDVHTQQSLMRLLRMRKIDVTAVDNGLACVDLALEAWDAGEMFDCLLIDIQMPYLRGYDVVSTLRDEGYPGLIIAMTAHSYLHDNSHARECGCDAYLEKPFGISKFLSLLRKNVRHDGNLQDSEKFVDDPLEAYPDVVLGFLDNLPGRLDEIKQAYDQKNWTELEGLVHKLCTAELMGYPELGRLSRQIEDECLKEDKGGISPLMTQLEETIRFMLADRPDVERNPR